MTLTDPQVRVLRMLYTTGGLETTANTRAGFVAGNVAAALCKRGLVEAVPGWSLDGGAYRVRLTDAGRALVYTIKALEFGRGGKALVMRPKGKAAIGLNAEIEASR